MGGMPGMMRRSRPRGPKTFKLYEILGIEKDCPQAQLTKAFRKRSIRGEYRHPDKGGDPSKFSQLKSAYEKLRTKDSRAEYDKYGDACLEEDFVGTPKRKMRQAKTTTFPLPVTLEQLYCGATRKIAVTRRVVINSKTGEVCPGDGQDLWRICDTCGGRGQVMRRIQPQPGYVIQTQVECPTCKGAGYSLVKDWMMSQKKEVLEIFIEKGMKNGNKIKFRQKGNMAPGCLPGDISVVLKEKKHNTFQRKNADLLMQKRISLHESLCGYEFTFQHLDGREMLIKSKPGEVVANNSLKMLEGEGFPHRGDEYERGSLFINFMVDFPDDGELTPAQQREIRTILTGHPTPTLCARTEDTEIRTFEAASRDQFGKTKYAFKDDGVYDESDSDDEDNRGGAQRCRVQ